jgi:hypothetical protein
MQSPTSQTHDLWTLVATLCRISQPKKIVDPKAQTAKIQQMWSSTIYVSEVVNKLKNDSTARRAGCQPQANPRDHSQPMKLKGK